MKETTYGQVSLNEIVTKGRKAATKLLTANGYTAREADEYILMARNSAEGKH